ncbi:MAG TPA: DUF5715 family protein [Gemmatimonadales bacterium]
MPHLPPYPDRLTAVLLAGAVLAVPQLVEAQSLRGSRASIERMYRQAVDHDLTFHRTSSGVRKAAAAGDYERLAQSTRHYRLHQVSHPYVVPAAKVFVERLASQYHDACGERLVVTSALRPSTRQPANSTERSVHPTGMAIDLRKPGGSCLTWLRTTLLALEESGVIEATEERHPPHFHVAVFPDQYTRYLGDDAPVRLARAVEARNAPTTRVTRVAATSSATSRTHYERYQVRSGDTLWHLARRYGTTVKRLRSINDLRTSTLRPGQKLLVPSSGS